MGQITICKVLSLKLSESTEGRSRQKANGTHRTMPWKLRCPLLRQGLHTHQQRELRTSPWGLVPPQQRLPPWNPGSERLFLHTFLSYLLHSHRMAGVGRDLSKTSSSTPPHTQILETSLHPGHSFLLMRLRAWKTQRQKSENTHTPSSIHTHTASSQAGTCDSPLGHRRAQERKPRSGSADVRRPPVQY